MTGARRHLTGAAASLLLLALALAAAGIVGAAGQRYHARADVTTTGEQRLAPRTLAVLERVASLGEVEIVIAVDASTIQPWSRLTVRDVLELFGHAGNVRASEIDVGSVAGQAEYARLIGRLVERERAGVELHAATLASAADAASAAAEQIEQGVAPSLLTLRDMLPTDSQAARGAGTGLEQWVAALRPGAHRMRDEAGAARRAVTEPDPALPIPPLAERETALRSAIQDRALELGALSAELSALGAASIGPDSIRSTCESLSRSVSELRDALARADDDLGRLPRLDILRVANALGTAEVALVIGPPGTGVAGIDIGALYEPRIVASEGDRLFGDVRFQAEELLGSAISSIMTSAKPIVVLTHGESARVLETSELFNGLRERLGQRGIDLIEWGVLRDDAPPGLAELDPDGLHPVVCATLAPDSSDAARSEEDVPGPERAASLGRALRRLLAERAPILLSVNPSVLPAYGEVDPIVAPFVPMGLEIRTGTPLLSGITTTRSREVFTELELLPERGDGPMLSAIRNLRTLLPWAIPVRVGAAQGALRVTPLLVVPDNGETWAETQWLRLWQTPRAQRAVLPEKPRFDEGVDDDAGPWSVALAAERTDVAQGSPAGRLVIVGSNGWFSDPAAFQYQTIDGRVSLSYPGNAELFEAAVLWLAGQDDLIAQSAGARAVALIEPIGPGGLTALRWALIAGLPLITLALGVAWRVIGK